MAITNAVIAKKLSDLVDAWQKRELEMQEWLAGTPDGGPLGDGCYNLTDYLGNTRLTKSPARLEADVSGLVDSASVYKDQAAASAADAATSAAAAASAAADALADRDLALVHKDGAVAARLGAENAAVNAHAALSAAQALAADVSALYASMRGELDDAVADAVATATADASASAAAAASSAADAASSAAASADSASQSETARDAAVVAQLAAEAAASAAQLFDPAVYVTRLPYAISSWNDVSPGQSGFVRSSADAPTGTSTTYFGISCANQAGSNYHFQIAGRNSRAFVRTMENGTWQSWNELFHTGHLPQWNEISGGSVQTIPGAGSTAAYGSLDITGAAGNYAGVHFRNAGATLMVRTTDKLTGMYDTSAGAWLWYFNGSGVLTAGTIPWARLSGVPSSFTPSSHNHSASNITSGTLPVARGGTGVTTSTGSGATVRNSSPNFTGTPTINGNPITAFTTGTFTASLVGVSGSSSGTIIWVRVGDTVTLYVQADLLGTSNNTAMRLSALPAHLRTNYDPMIPCIVRVGTSNRLAYATLWGDGVIDFQLHNGSTFAGFPTSGTKGLPRGWVITYRTTA